MMTEIKIVWGVITAVLVVLAAWAGVTVGDRSFPTRVESARLLTPRVRAGGELLTARVVHRERLCHTTIDRMMFDHRGVRYDRVDDGLGVVVYPNGTGQLGRESFIGRQTVPEAMPPGPARYVALVCYRCSWAQYLWPLCEPPREQKFIIVD